MAEFTYTAEESYRLAALATAAAAYTAIATHHNYMVYFARQMLAAAKARPNDKRTHALMMYCAREEGRAEQSVKAAAALVAMTTATPIPYCTAEESPNDE